MAAVWKLSIRCSSKNHSAILRHLVMLAKNSLSALVPTSLLNLLGWPHGGVVGGVLDVILDVLVSRRSTPEGAVQRGPVLGRRLSGALRLGSKGTRILRACCARERRRCAPRSLFCRRLFRKRLWVTHQAVLRKGSQMPVNLSGVVRWGTLKLDPVMPVGLVKLRPGILNLLRDGDGVLLHPLEVGGSSLHLGAGLLEGQGVELGSGRGARRDEGPGDLLEAMSQHGQLWALGQQVPKGPEDHGHELVGLRLRRASTLPVAPGQGSLGHKTGTA